MTRENACVVNLIGLRSSPWSVYCLAHCVSYCLQGPPPRLQDDSSHWSSSHLSSPVAMMAAHPVVAISHPLWLWPGPLSHRRRRPLSDLGRHCRRPVAVSPACRSHCRICLAILIVRPSWGSPPWRSPEALFRSALASPLFTRLPPFLFGRYPPGKHWR